jgi:hypothetical protein
MGLDSSTEQTRPVIAVMVTFTVIESVPPLPSETCTTKLSVPT